jgi:serine phosphatase RsbU (regulator of sigma subunit)
VQRQDERRRSDRPALARRRRTQWIRAVLAPIMCVGIGTGIGLILPHGRTGVPATILLMGVVGSALIGGLWAGIAASVLAVVSLDFVFLAQAPAAVSSNDIALIAVFVVTAFLATVALQRLQQARREADQGRIRSSVIASVTMDLASATSLSDVGRLVAEHMSSALGAKAVGVFLLDPSGDTVGLLDQRGYPADLIERWRRFPLAADVPASEVIRTHRSVLLGSLGERSAHYGRDLGRSPTMGAGALAALPILVGGATVGAVTLSFPDDHRFPPEDLAFLETIVLQAAQAIERAQLHEAEAVAQDRAAFLANASGVLASSIDYERTLSEAASLAVPRFADWSAVDLLMPDDEIRLVSLAHRDPEMIRWARTLRSRQAPSLADEDGIGMVIRTGEMRFYPAFDQAQLEARATSEGQLDAIRKIHPSSAIIAPLIARDAVLGAVTFIYSSPERLYAEADLGIAGDLAGRAAIAIDNARLYAALNESREAAIQGQSRLRILSTVSRALVSSLDFDATVQEVARLAVRHLSDVAVVYLARPVGQLQAAAFAQRADGVEGVDGNDPENGRGEGGALAGGTRSVPETPAYVVTAFRTGEPQAVGGERAERPVASALAAPLSLGERTLGVIWLGWLERRDVPAEDVAMAEEVARRMARAIENARLYDERDRAASTLQRNLLPPTVPEIPGIRVAARYQPAGAGNEVGGDFYDVFAAGDGWILTIGDVCGKGPEAAAVMAIARFTMRPLALSETRPSELLAALNTFLLEQSPDDRFCTAACARLHQFEGGYRLTVACGGHPRPMVLRANGTVEPVGRHGMLLGAMHEVTLWDEWADLHGGDAVVFYTDGLEHPGEAVEDTVQRILRGRSVRDPEELLEGILEARAESQPRGSDDDVAVIVVQVEASL